MSNTPDMFDGTGKETGLLSHGDAVEVLLNQNSPIEDTEEVSKEDNSAEEAQAEVTEEEAEATEEVEATEETEETEAKSDDEPDAEQEAETETEESEFVLELDGVEMTPEQIKKEWEGRGLRQADYTRKTQEIAETRRAFEAEQAQTQELQQRLSEALKETEQILLDRNTEPNWSDLSQKLDPRQFNQVKAKWEESQSQLKHIQEQRKAVQDKELYDKQVQQHNHLVQENAKLLELFPTWKDPQVKQAEISNVVNYMLESGLPEDTIRALNDNGNAMAINFIWKSMKYDNLNSKSTSAIVKKKIKNVPKVSKSGTPTSSKERVSEAHNKASARLTKSGKIDDAVNLLLTQ